MSRVVLRSLVVAAVVLGSLVCSSATVALGQETRPADVRGEWQGNATVDIGVFPNTFSLTEEDFTTGAVHGTANAGADVIDGTVTGNTFTFTSARPGYTATGVLVVSADGSTMTGTFTDTNGRSGTFLMQRTSGLPDDANQPLFFVSLPSASAPPGPATAPPDETTSSSQPEEGRHIEAPHSTLEYVLPGPLQISLAPEDVARSLGIMSFIMLFVGAPTPIFNSTLSANRVLIERWARRRRPAWLRRFRPARPTAPAQTAGAPAAARGGLSHTWPGLILYLLLAAFVYSFLDLSFPGADWPRVLFVTSMAIAIGTAVSQIPEERYVRTRYGSRGTVDVALWTIVLAIGCVVVTRLFAIQPGYVYGIIGGFTFTVALSKADEGRMAWRGMGLLIVVGISAWFLRIPFQPIDGVVDGEIGSVANDILAGTFVSAVQGAAIALIPLEFLAGHRLLAASRSRWIALWAISLLLFAHVVVYPVSTYSLQPSEAALWSLMLVVVAYAAVALGFWGFFHRRSVRRKGRRARAAAYAASAAGEGAGPGELPKP